MPSLLNLAKHWAMEPDALMQLGTQMQATLPEAQLQHKVQDTACSENGIAIISIQGPIVARACVLSSLLGATALDEISDAIDNALCDDDVHALLLEIDSPGGVAVGPCEVAEKIREASQHKPVWAYIAGHGTSAAYWLASAATHISASRTAMIGSIGVVTAIPVQEQPDSDGYRHIEIVSSNAAHKRPDPRTPDGMAAIRAELDSLEAEFINSIARYRNVSTDTVRDDFGQGGVLLGPQAKACHMIDAIDTFDNVLAALTAKATTHSTHNHRSDLMINKDETNTTPLATSRNAEPATAPTTTAVVPTPQAPSTILTVDDIKANHPVLFDAITLAAMDAGRKAEQARLMGIDKATLPGHEALAAKAKQDPNMTGEKLALQIINVEKGKGADFLVNAKTTEDTLPEINPSVEPTVDPYAVAADAPVDVKAKASWEKDASLRKEFDSYETWLAFCQAFDNGQVKIYQPGQPQRGGLPL